GIRALLQRRAWTRVRLRWCVVAFALPFAVAAAALALDAATAGTVPRLPAPLPRDLSSLSGSSVGRWVGVPLLLLAGSFGEELGWRGFLLPHLQRRWTALTASLLLAGLWLVWHLPLFLVADSAQSAIPIAWYLPYVVAQSVWHTSLFNGAKGSVLPSVLLHASVQAASVFLPLLPSVAGSTRAYEWLVLLTCVVALLVVRVGGPASLAGSAPSVTSTSSPSQTA
ncbi:MAG: CPBP family intramembrane glutamic endopeptidase, partial [Myxococcales bacterium]